MSDEPTFVLQRVRQNSEGTLGQLADFSTIERPWLDNRPRVSCIPAATYLCKPRMFERGGYMTYEVTGVPDRSLILLHIANFPADVLGCIGVGMAAGTLNGHMAVLRSREGFQRWKASMQGVDLWWLEIRDVQPEIPEPLIRVVSSMAELEPEDTEPLGAA